MTEMFVLFADEKINARRFSSGARIFLDFLQP